MTNDPRSLILKRDPVGQNPEDYSVLENAVVIVGRRLVRLRWRRSQTVGGASDVRGNRVPPNWVGREFRSGVGLEPSD
jgi:hypothetical protein